MQNELGSKDVKTDQKVILVKPKKKVTFAIRDMVIYGDSSLEQSEEEEIDQSELSDVEVQT